MIWHPTPAKRKHGPEHLLKKHLGNQVWWFGVSEPLHNEFGPISKWPWANCCPEATYHSQAQLGEIPFSGAVKPITFLEGDWILRVYIYTYIHIIDILCTCVYIYIPEAKSQLAWDGLSTSSPCSTGWIFKSSWIWSSQLYI